MITVEIEMTHPPRILSPNHTVGSRGQRMAKAKAVKALRTKAKLLFMSLYSTTFRPMWRRATVEIIWHHKTAGFPDRDNIIGSLKAAFDGLADAGLLHNDRGLTQLPPVRLIDPENPRVILKITGQ